MGDLSQALASVFRPVRIMGPPTRSLGRQSLLSAAGLVAQGLLRFVTAVLVARMAGPETLGLVASAIALASVFALVGPAAAGSAASAFLARERASGDGTRAIATVAHIRRRTVQASFVLGPLAALVWQGFDAGTWGGALAVAMLTVAIAAYLFVRGVLFGAGKAARSAAWDALTVTLGLSLLGVLLALGARGIAVVVALSATYSLYALAGWPYDVRRTGHLPRQHSIDKFIVVGTVGTLASAGFLQAAQLAANLAGGNRDAGLFAAALGLVTPISIVGAAVGLVLLPSLAESHGLDDELTFDQRADLGTRLMMIVMVAALGPLVIAEEVIVDKVWGAEFADVSQVLPWLAGAVLASNAAVPSVSALVSVPGRGIVVAMWCGLSGLLVGVVSWSALAPQLGIRGVAIGYLLGTLTTSLTAMIIEARRGSHGWGSLLAKVTVGIAGAGGMAVCAKGTSTWLAIGLATAFLIGWLVVNEREFRSCWSVVGLNRQRLGRPRGKEC